MLRLTARGAAAVGMTGSAWSARADDLAFFVVNDLHYRDARCGAWLEGVVAAMQKHRADFCVLNGDLSEHGTAEELDAVKTIFAGLRIPVFTTIGNHDYAANDDRRGYERLFPKRLNYRFDFRGWQFVALDTTHGQQVFYTRIGAETLAWLDRTLPSLDQNKPTVLLSHFPLGRGVWCRPRNAPEVLQRFRGVNLRAVFNGHWHGFTERRFGDAPVVTNRCCSLWRANNDGTPEKGYFLCRARDGEITRTFYEVRAAFSAGKVV